MAVNSFNAQNPPVTTKGDLFTFSTIPTRLGVGANNTVLTADSATATGLKWAAVDASSMTSLATGSLSGSTLDLQSISSGYRTLYLVLNGVAPVTNTGSFNMRFNGDSNANRYASTSENSDANYRAVSATSISLTGGFSNTSTTQSIFITIPEYASTQNWKVATTISQNTSTAGSNANVLFTRQIGMWNQTTAINRIEIIPAGGFVSQGTYTLYGVK